MKKLIGIIRTKEQTEKAILPADNKAAAKLDKASEPAQSREQSCEKAPRELFWDDYSDLGYC
ncbi:MAG: hypothetical protein KDD27_24315 [Saprospiraceae bacterium]|nr:hypothetical protein [Saprospiraceae bacterium]